METVVPKPERPQTSPFSGRSDGLRHRAQRDSSRIVAPALSEDEEEDDEDDGSSLYDEPDRCCRFVCRRWATKIGLRKFCPGCMPFLIIFVFFAIVVFCAIRRLAEDSTPPWEGYLVYLLVTSLILLIWMILRFFWVAFVSRRVLPENRFVVAMNAVLDPEIIYLFAAISICFFWAYVPASPLVQTSLGKYLGLKKLEEGPSNDLKLLLRVTLFMILWTTKNVMQSVLTFHFLTGFFMAFNPSLVKYLTAYGLVRRLNSSWVRVLPFMIGHRKSISLHESPTDLTAATDGPGLRHILTNVAGGAGETYPQRTSNFPKNLMSELQSGKEAEDHRIELTGGTMPGILLKRRIQQTQESSVVNLLAIEYCRQYPPALFVNGSRIELVAKKIAKQAANDMFDEILKYRDLLAPTGTQEERNKVARASIVELKKIEEQSIASRGKRFSTRRSSREFLGMTKQLSELSATELQNITEQIEEQARHLPSIKEDHEPSASVARSQLHFRSEAEHQTAFSEVQEPGEFVELFSEDFDKCSPHVLLRDAFLNDWDSKSDARSLLSQDSSDEEAQTSQTGFMARREMNHQMELIEHGKKLKKQNTKFKNQYLTVELLEYFLGDQTEEFLRKIDPGGRGRISRQGLCRAIVDIYRLRKQLVHLITSQESIRKIVSRMISLTLAFVFVLFFLVITGVPADTIIISGAAVLSSCTVILSFMYTGFVQAIIFVCFLNPYNVGDRVTIDNEIHTVKKINTYFTEFVTMQNKPETFNHSTLFTKTLINESRNKNAGLEIKLLLDFQTQQSKYEALHYIVEQFVQTHNEFVKDSFVCIMGDVIVGNSIQFTYWITCVESWGQWKSVFAARALIMKLIMEECEKMSISYRLPLLPFIVRDDQVQIN